MQHPARILAVTVSAVLGMLFGVGAGMVLDKSYQDPLGLGVPMVNQQCQGNEALLVLVTGDNSGDLGSDVASHDGARYLETSNSCRTAWRRAGRRTESYAAYVGPYGRRTACEKQMTGDYRGAHVTMLTEDTSDTVICSCYVAQGGIPELRPGLDMNDQELVYLHDLQRLLIALEIRPDEPADDFYDPETERQVARFQQAHGHEPTGTMGADTWRPLLRAACV